MLYLKQDGKIKTNVLKNEETAIEADKEVEIKDTSKKEIINGIKSLLDIKDIYPEDIAILGGYIRYTTTIYVFDIDMWTTDYYFIVQKVVPVDIIDFDD